MSKRKRQNSRGKKIKPVYWVFCEGDTEKAYIEFLKDKYRIPIKIKTKVTKTNINEKVINNKKKDEPKHPKDKTFLMYDGDREDVLKRIRDIKNVTLLVSAPCIELWFLLHYKNQTANISINECGKELSNRNKNTYKKGALDSKLKGKLNEKHLDACKRAKEKTLFNNPSSNIYELIEILEEFKALKHTHP